MMLLITTIVIVVVDILLMALLELLLLLLLLLPLLLVEATVLGSFVIGVVSFIELSLQMMAVVVVLSFVYVVHRMLISVMIKFV